MTIEIPRLVTDGILISTIIWQLQRVIWRLGEKQREVDALRDMISYLLLTRRNYETEHKSTDSGPARAASPLLTPDRAPSRARERRLFPRHQTSKAGKIILHHGRPGDLCTVCDFSPAGVGLVLPATDSILMAEFELTFDETIRHCVTVWRRLNRVGVKIGSKPWRSGAQT
jgi:hypothetical protein